jgi:hypothetical protein
MSGCGPPPRFVSQEMLEQLASHPPQGRGALRLGRSMAKAAKPKPGLLPSIRVTRDGFAESIGQRCPAAFGASEALRKGLPADRHNQSEWHR